MMLTYWSVKCGLLWLISSTPMFLPRCLLFCSTNPGLTRRPRESPDERPEHTSKHDIPTSSATGSVFFDYVGRHRKSTDRHIISREVAEKANGTRAFLNRNLQSQHSFIHSYSFISLYDTPQQNMIQATLLIKTERNRKSEIGKKASVQQQS